MNKKLVELKQLLESNKKYEESALEQDDKQSTCAANHRGAIRVYNMVIHRLQEILEDFKTQP